MIITLAPKLLAFAGIVGEFAKSHASLLTLFVNVRQVITVTVKTPNVSFSALTPILLGGSHCIHFHVASQRPGVSYSSTFFLFAQTLTFPVIIVSQMNLLFEEDKLRPREGEENDPRWLDENRVPGLQAQALPAQGAPLPLNGSEECSLKLSHHVPHPQVSNTLAI